ncbi:hypothetical protein [Cellulophaga tyrosinoxydans]|uniref:Uncharacterized protein n=1 Tax=Cellulophaga tyrosinoxydans TaxID=504486 RepID=A0A1W1YWW4_9FLAO|nr:hypothetical protein [Cellulophaga tyrosinoxydans]SMC40198.1 hypothetical protein SAMN05660703_0947 [Cellulophaga tyrosinoxydans]
MKQISISILMGIMCIAAWIIAAPVLAQKNTKIEREKVEIASEAQTLTML